MDFVEFYTLSIPHKSGNGPKFIKSRLTNRSYDMLQSDNGGSFI